MAKIQNAANSTEESIGIAMSRTELFFEKNGKALTLGLIVLVLLGGLWVGYTISSANRVTRRPPNCSHRRRINSKPMTPTIRSRSTATTTAQAFSK